MTVPASTPLERASATILALALLALAVWAALQPWGLRWDFANFYDTGRRIRTGGAHQIYDATSPVAGVPPVGVMRFWGSPISGLLYVPLAAMTPRTALAVFKLFNVAVYVAVLVLMVRLYLKPLDLNTGMSSARKTVLFLLICAMFQPFWTVFYVGGQTTPVVLLLLIGFVLTFTAGRETLSAPLLAAVFVIKPAFLVMAVMLLIAGQMRLLRLTAAWVAGAGVVSLGLFGWPVHAAFLDRMTRGLGSPRLWQFNSSLVAFVDNFRLVGDHDPPPTVGRILQGLTILLRVTIVWIFIEAWRAGRRQVSHDEGRRHFAALLSILFFLLFSEIVWEHYMMVLFVPAMFVLARLPRFSPGAARLVIAALLLCAFQNIFLARTLDRLVEIDSIVEVVLVGLVKSGPLIAMALFLVRYSGELAAAYPAGASERHATTSHGERNRLADMGRHDPDVARESGGR